MKKGVRGGAGSKKSPIRIFFLLWKSLFRFPRTWCFLGGGGDIYGHERRVISRLVIGSNCLGRIQHVSKLLASRKTLYREKHCMKKGGATRSFQRRVISSFQSPPGGGENSLESRSDRERQTPDFHTLMTFSKAFSPSLHFHPSLLRLFRKAKWR